MKPLTTMVVKRYAGGRGKDKYRYYMREAYCPRCKDYYAVPFEENFHRCINCKTKMRYRLKEIDRPNYEEHYAPERLFKRDKRVKDVGRKVKKYHD